MVSSGGKFKIGKWLLEATIISSPLINFLVHPKIEQCFPGIMLDYHSTFTITPQTFLNRKRIIQLLWWLMADTMFEFPATGNHSKDI